MIFAPLAAMLIAAPAPAPMVRPELQPLAFLVGHCWRGRFAGGEEDFHCFEPVYDGQHVRDRHRVEGGGRPYSGETLYSWDAAAGAVSYTYWNSEGGVSRGTMRAEPGKLVFGDEAYRGPDGRQVTLSSSWVRAGETAYETRRVSAGAPAMSRIVRYERIAPRVTVREEKAPDGSFSLIHEAEVQASTADLWAAITTAEGWKSWAVPVAWIDPARPDLIETSYSPDARAGAANNIQQRILAGVPGRLLAFRTVQAPRGFPDFAVFTRVVSVFELEPIGPDRTRVRLTGAGYPDDEAGRRLIDFFRDGNRISLERLQQRFRDGPLDWSRILAGAARD